MLTQNYYGWQLKQHFNRVTANQIFIKDDTKLIFAIEEKQIKFNTENM